MARRFLRLIIVLLALGQMGASCHGTETGNPGNPGGTTGGVPTNCPAALTSGSDQSVDDLIFKICQRVIGCGVVTTTDTCVNALNGTDGDPMVAKFGFTLGTTIVQLRADLISGTVAANAANEASCENDIAVVTCSDVNPAVTGSDFSKVAAFIPDSCVGVYASAEASAANPCSP